VCDCVLKNIFFNSATVVTTNANVSDDHFRFENWKSRSKTPLNSEPARAIIVNIDLQRDIKDVIVLCCNACQYTFYVNMYKHLLESRLSFAFMTFKSLMFSGLPAVLRFKIVYSIKKNKYICKNTISINITPQIQLVVVC
jgi:hypothetical protein